MFQLRPPKKLRPERAPLTATWATDDCVNVNTMADSAMIEGLTLL